MVEAACTEWLRGMAAAFAEHGVQLLGSCCEAASLHSVELQVMEQVAGGHTAAPPPPSFPPRPSTPPPAAPHPDFCTTTMHGRSRCLTLPSPDLHPPSSHPPGAHPAAWRHETAAASASKAAAAGPAKGRPAARANAAAAPQRAEAAGGWLKASGFCMGMGIA